LARLRLPASDQTKVCRKLLRGCNTVKNAPVFLSTPAARAYIEVAAHEAE
jgi:hypothetical protein